MSQETAVIQFPHPVPVAQLQCLILDLTNPEISRNTTVWTKRTESPDAKPGLWFKVSVMVPVGDVPEVNKMIERYVAIRRISKSGLAPLG